MTLIAVKLTDEGDDGGMEKSDVIVAIECVACHQKRTNLKCHIERWCSAPSRGSKRLSMMEDRR